ncbi:ABC transporter ATP-binding protein (plasmid) [Mesorhizobium sp. 131-3-5]|nr:ABC transporter ATP-binding protein [Mesorhizobium sp. 131-3-5]
MKSSPFAPHAQRDNASADELLCDGISVRFGGLAALDNVSFKIQGQEIFGLIGPNGAGKTTLTNVVSGFQKPSKGAVFLCGEQISGHQPHVVAQSGIGRTFQGGRVFSSLSVTENIEASILSTGASRNQARASASDLGDWIGLGSKLNTQASALPYTDQRRLGIIRALGLRPKFLLLDEPAAGMSDGEAEALIESITTIPAFFGCGIMLIEHNMQIVMNVCQRIHVLDFGKTIAEGTPAEMQAHPEVLNAYLGTEEG